MDISQPYYSQLEDGSKKISNASAEKLGEYYGVSKEIFMNDKQPVINHNIGEHSKGIGIINSDQYYESNKDLLHPILDRMDKLLTLLFEDKKDMATERKQLLAAFDKLADKLGK